MNIIIELGGTREATREVLGAWLEKNEEKPFMRVIGMLLTTRQYREGFEQGHSEGYAMALEQGRAEVRTWYNRQQAALEKGEPFDEPPPWDDRSRTEN